MSTSVVNVNGVGGGGGGGVVVGSRTNSFPTNGGIMHTHHHHQVLVERRNRSPLKVKMPAPSGSAPVGGTALPLYPRCSCCPFGYHIDLDFINYCQSLGKADLSQGQKLRRDRRRQRQSMEIMLGLGPMFQQMDTLQMLPKVGEASESTPSPMLDAEAEKKRGAVTANEKRLASAFANNALADVVQDFEKTLERSRTKSTSVEHEPTPDREEVEQRRRTFDSRMTTREKFFMEYEQNHARSSLPLERNMSTYDNVDHMIRNNDSNRLKDVDTMSVKSCASSTGSEMSHGAMQYIREQMAASLNKIRDLEEQTKSIPLLQMELKRLKEEKRDLEGQVHHLQQEKRTSRSPFSPQRVSPVQLQATAFNEMMQTRVMGMNTESVLNKAQVVVKAKLTREIGIQHTTVAVPPIDPPVIVAPPALKETRTIGIGSDKRLEKHVGEKLYTEMEVKKLLEDSKVVPDLRSVGCQMDTEVIKEKEPCAQCLVYQNELNKKAVCVPRGVQTETPKKVATREASVSVSPEKRSVGVSDHSIVEVEVPCDKCSVKKRSIGSATAREWDQAGDSVGPVSLKLLDKLSTGRSRSDLSIMTTSMESTVSQSSIGTQIGNTRRDAGCQSAAVVVNNKSSQSDTVLVKGKGTDTSGLFELNDQGVNTESNNEEEEQKKRQQEDEERRRLLMKALKTKGTNTDLVRTNETAANTERVSQRDAAVEVETKEEEKVRVETIVETVRVEVPAPLPKHVSIGCEDVNGCGTCQERILELAKRFQSDKPEEVKQEKAANKIVAGGSTESAGTSKIPRPSSAMSPKPQRKPIAVLKRQDTYTVEQPVVANSATNTHQESQETRVEAVEPLMVKKTGLGGLKGPVTDLIGLGEIKNGDQKQHQENDAVPVKTLPNDRPMSLVQELDESAQQSDDDYEERPAGEAKKEQVPQSPRTTTPETVKTTIKTTTVLKVPRQSTSSQSIPEEDIRKEFPNLPRKPARPSREMSGALKVINDSLMKSMDGHSLLNANTIVRREWFQVSSSESADGLDVEDYLDCFEEYSTHLLRYMVNLTDANGNTAMHYAVSHGNFDIVSILLDSKVCHVNQMNNAGYTCVMLVSLVKLIEPAHRHVVQRLFQMSDVNIKAKKHNQTALMLAVSHGNLDMVQILLEAGADINIQDEDGSTALMCAAEHGKIDIVKLLLAQQDCDSSIQDVDGSTALKIALDAGYRDIGILLYAHDHMSRHRSPHSTLPRKSKLSTASMTQSARFSSSSASCPSSPAPTKKFFEPQKK